MTLVLLLLIIAFVLALIAAIGVATRVGLFPLAFAIYVLVAIIRDWHR